MSYGVAIERNVFFTGSHSVALKVPAANRSRSLPDPWTRSTWPFESSAELTARTGEGVVFSDHLPAPQAEGGDRESDREEHHDLPALSHQFGLANLAAPLPKGYWLGRIGWTALNRAADGFWCRIGRSGD